MSISNDLRQAVLQAAIQGKLTKQLPEDGNARELLEQIKAEKVKLVKEGKLKKEKPLPEITDDEKPFDIPENWEWVKLGTVCKSISAGGDKPKKFMPNATREYTVPVIANGVTNKGIFGYTDKATVTEKSLTVSGRGTIGYTEIRIEPYVPIVRLLVVIPMEMICMEYLKVAIQTFAEFGIGSAVKQLTVPMLTPKVIPIPPFSEQKRIVTKIEELMTKIDELEKTEKELEALKKTFPTDMKASLLQAAIQGNLTEQLPEDGNAKDLLEQIKAEKAKLIKEGKLKKEKPLPEITEDEKPFDIPENWEWVRLRLICKKLID